MEEEKKEIEVTEEQPSTKGKIDFPISGIVIIGVLAILMIVCIILIKVL